MSGADGTTARVIEALAKHAKVLRSGKNPLIASEAAKLEIFCDGLIEILREGHPIDFDVLLHVAKEQHLKVA